MTMGRSIVLFFMRLYTSVIVGIGDPPGTMDMKAFLLQKFSDIERKEVT